MTQAVHDDSHLVEVIKAYMRAHGLTTHEEMAQVLGIERSLVTKYFNGSRMCRDVVQLREYAQAMDLPPETFGLLATHSTEVAGASTDWRLVRQTLNRNRHALTGLAARLYWDAIRIEGTDCLTCPSWLAPTPMDLRTIQLTLESEAPPPTIDGSEPESAAYRPTRPAGARYRRYSQAVRGIAKPELFENRTSYRLLDAEFTDKDRRMRFGLTTYFDMVDTCEVLAHETASAWIANRSLDEKISMGDLPFRRMVGDLFDLARRPVLPSINTLTIRRAPDGDTFFLHRRGTTKVATAVGLTHVIPAGVFQPAAIGQVNVARDFSLWRNMLREFSEELLDTPEHDGSSGTPVDYDEEPFHALTAGLQDGRAKAWCFGIGLDPMTPAGEILTTVVIDSDLFDTAFPEIVSENAEGEVYPSDAGTVGIRWTPANVRKALNHEPLAPSAAACLALTWKHRDLLLPETQR